MKIRNYYVDDTYNLVNELIAEIIKNNISYVLLPGENYLEIHFLQNIYRFHFKDKIEKKPMYVNDDPFEDLFESIADNNINKMFTCNRKIKISYGYDKNERPAFKKYTKKDIRRDSKNNKINSKVKRKLSIH